MKIDIPFCCEQMKINVEDTCVITYDDVFDEYSIKLPEDDVSYVLIHYCPWCAAKLPDSQREKWFEELEKLGFDEPFSQNDIPDQFKSNQWRMDK